MDFNKIVIDRAKTSDAKALTHISKRTFDDDSKRFLNRESGGPPGYSTEKVTMKNIKFSDYYKIRLEDYTTIGGLIISQKNSICYLQRMFIDISYQNQGLGKYVFDYIQTFYPDIEEWKLETPCDNIRTNHFYSKCGFKLTKTEKGFNYYSKSVDTENRSESEVILMEELGIPIEHTICSAAAIGYIGKESSPPPRKKNTIHIIK